MCLYVCPALLMPCNVTPLVCVQAAASGAARTAQLRQRLAALQGQIAEGRAAASTQRLQLAAVRSDTLEATAELVRAAPTLAAAAATAATAAASAATAATAAAEQRQQQQQGEEEEGEAVLQQQVSELKVSSRGVVVAVPCAAGVLPSLAVLCWSGSRQTAIW
jgi:hypothetical protein